MTLDTLKHGGTWDWIGKTFDVKGPTFERLIKRFIEQVSDKLYDVYVECWGRELKMAKLRTRSQAFRNFLDALYATDVTFQLDYSPSGNVQEGSSYYSGKQKSYRYKVECSVLPNGICVGCSKQYPGSKSYLETMRTMEQFHLSKSTKNDQETATTDMVPLNSQYSSLCVILFDKGY